MHSLEHDKIIDFLKGEKFYFTNNIHIQPESRTILISLPYSVVATVSSENKVSERKLTLMKGKAKAILEARLEFIFTTDEEQRQLESGLYSLLSKRFEGQTKSLFLSASSPNSLNLWLEPTSKSQSGSLVSNDIRETVETYLSLYNKTLQSILSVIDEKLAPTSAQILREIKKAAPIDVVELNRVLLASELHVESITWLEHKLDTLRRRQMTARLKNGSYVLTSTGLALVPHPRNRSSSDVERALALGRMKW